MPSEKAHGIQIAKMCEAFAEAGIDLELVVPTRRTVSESVQDFYHLRVPVAMTRLLVPDLYLYGTVGYRISSYFFMARYVLFLWWKKVKGEHFIMYTVDLDNFSSSALALVPGPLYSEMHGGKPHTLMQRGLFRRARGIVAINCIIAEELKKTFSFSPTTYIVEPNGVDASSFAPREQAQSRKELGLPLEKKIVLYTGRFFDWKGLEILPQAAVCTPNIVWYIVGGDEKQFKQFVKEPLPNNIYFVGERPHKEMSAWLSAADALVVLGTKRDTQSYYYTSPMKLFEYFLSRRPIVASNTPAIRQIVSEREVFLYEPDSASDLAQKVAYATQMSDDVRAHIAAAEQKGKQFSWKARAERIAHFIAST